VTRQADLELARAKRDAVREKFDLHAAELLAQFRDAEQKFTAGLAELEGNAAAAFTAELEVTSAAEAAGQQEPARAHSGVGADAAYDFRHESPTDSLYTRVSKGMHRLHIRESSARQYERESTRPPLNPSGRPWAS
jgi:hypothetical protein